MIAYLSRAHRALLSLLAFASLALLGSGETLAALTLSGDPHVGVMSGSLYSWAPTASGTTRLVKYKVVNKPAWLTFDVYTGRLKGTAPSVSSTADYQKYTNITISAYDGVSAAQLPPFTIWVVNAARAPKISGTPPTTVSVGQAYSFRPTVSDPDGDPLKFSIANKPAWAAFDTTTGRLYGTPSATGTWSSISIKVNDGTSSAYLPAFSIQVVSSSGATTNTAPTISGAPSLTAYVGKAYAFQPTASDANGDPLTFSIANKPGWATFSTSTGRLSGTPSAASTFSNITITVSDGKTSKSLAPFTLNVVAATTMGSATLSWVAPTTDTAGAPLNGLAGYRVRYGTSPTALTNVITLPGVDSTSVTIEELTAGTHYFAVTAYMVNGLESELSQVVYKTIM